MRWANVLLRCSCVCQFTFLSSNAFVPSHARLNAFIFFIRLARESFPHCVTFPVTIIKYRPMCLLSSFFFTFYGKISGIQCFISHFTLHWSTHKFKSEKKTKNKYLPKGASKIKVITINCESNLHSSTNIHESHVCSRKKNSRVFLPFPISEFNVKTEEQEKASKNVALSNQN